MFVVVVVVVGVIVGPGGWWHQGGRGRNNLPEQHKRLRMLEGGGGVRIRSVIKLSIYYSLILNAFL